jgi:LmbE family N-acetylglucosaminyl deacetylase
MGNVEAAMRDGLEEADPTNDGLPAWRRPLAVVAHPDDESFGLGAVLARFVEQGAAPSVLCFTHGEASTLHGVEGDLRRIRAAELASAAQLLGLTGVELLDQPDGGLDDLDSGTLYHAIEHAIHQYGADGLLTFDTTGVTGHPDHIAAAHAAISVGKAQGLPVLGWTLPEAVAQTLTAESGAPFAGRTPGDLDLALQVSRETQLQAVQAHPSQAVPGSILWRRLELLGDREYLTWLVPPHS